LKKKSDYIAYHFVREGVTANEWLNAYESMDTNPSDVMTKPLPAGARSTKLVRGIMYDI
jgi:hypothetical protein